MLSSGKLLISIEWFAIATTFLLASTLIYIRLARKVPGQRTSGVPDFFVLLAWTSFFTYGCIDTIFYHYGFVPTGNSTSPEVIEFTTKLWYAQNVIELNATYAVKAGMLLHFFSFIPGYLQRLRLALWIISGIVFLAWSSQFFAAAFWCLPVSRIWSTSADTTPPNWSIWGGIIMYRTIMHLVTDILVYLLPITTISHIILTGKQRVGLLIVIAIGTTCIAIAVITIINLYIILSDGLAFLLQTLDQATGLLILSYPVFKHYFYTPRQQKLKWKNVKMAGVGDSQDSMDGSTIKSQSLDGANDYDIPRLVEK